MELFLVYLWLKLDSLLGVFGVLLAATTIGLLVSLGNFGDAQNNLSHYRELYHSEVQTARVEFWKPWIKRFVIGWFVCVFSLVTIPSSKETAILVGSAIAIDMAKSPEGQKIGSLIRGKANEYLDAELKKLQPQPAK